LLTAQALLAVSLSAPVFAEDQGEVATKAIMAQFPEVDGLEIAPAPIEGLYEVRLGSQISYITADGRYLFQGDILDAENDINLTEIRRTSARIAAIEELGESSMIIFEAQDVKHTITVFTDIDCGYCRKLHREIDQYNELGFRVRYMFYPRSGPQTESWFKAENVWCAEDRNTALTEAKGGAVIDSGECGLTPVAEHYMLGQDFGIRGTPAIVAETGELIGGYVPPKELLEYLEEE
jgi:thiol:disulfide interchange protein DsbC